MKNGFFITLEGGEGTGKSTLLRGLVEYFTKKNIDTISTREPGGTKGAELIRELLVQGDAARWNAMSEICLFYAAREDHIFRIINPALKENKVVLCDRFFDSTRAYQGKLGTREAKVIKSLEENIVGPCLPNLTLILDIDVKIGLKRANSRNDKEGRFEAKNIDFHENLRQAFLDIAKQEPERCKIIDAQKTPQEVLEIAIALIEKKLGQFNV